MNLGTKQQEILEKYDPESVVRFLHGWQKKLVSFIAICYSLFHIYITFYPLPTLLQRSIHVAVGCALIFLVYPASKNSNRKSIAWWDFILAALSLSGGIYLLVIYQDIVTTRGGILTDLDIAFAMLTVLMVMITAQRITGWVLIILASIFLIYPFISGFSWIPSALLTRSYDLGDIFGQLYLNTEGLYSTAIGASVSFIFLFILFGAFLQRSGMGELFTDLAIALAGTKEGGPAKVAVISSGLMGSINGAAVANVVSTGAFTIPLMKKVGYDKNFAGAVEASASIGGQILPPIMGASAFIMAETTGVSYGTIALAGLLPAVLYYLAVLAQVHFRAKKLGLKGIALENIPKLKTVLKARGHMLLPIVVLIYFLSQGTPIGVTACYTIAFSIVISWISKNTRMGLKSILLALEDGAKQSLSVMAACAVIGVVIGVINLTSLGNVITSSIITLGAGSLLITLIFTMLASLVLGMGLPSIPAYILTATIAAPALSGFGVPILVAHMFVFYFGIFANITPPVALASFAGAGIAKGDPMKTGWQSLKLALAGFIIPFMFVYNPTMLMIEVLPGTDIGATTFAYPPIFDIVFVIITSLVGVIALSAAIEGQLNNKLSYFLRFILLLGSLLLIFPEIYTGILGFIILLVVYFFNRTSSKSI